MTQGMPITQLLGEAQQYLAILYHDTPADATVVVSTAKGASRWVSHPYSPSVVNAIAQEFVGNTETDVYVRTSVLSKRWNGLGRGMKEDTYGTSILHVDIDLEGDEPRIQSTLDELTVFSPLPTMVVRSGGGIHVYWQIPFTQDWQRVERVNKWLALQITGGDLGTFNVDRVLRLPGTFNTKPTRQSWCRLVECHADRTYTLDDFQEADLNPVQQQTLPHIEAATLPSDFEDALHLKHDKLWQRIYTAETALTAGADIRPDGTVDRSRNDAVISIWLLQIGRTDSEVLAVLQHPTWFSGERFRERYDENYTLITLLNAKSYVADVQLKSYSDISAYLREKFQIMHTRSKWFVYNHSQGVYVEDEPKLQLAIQAVMSEAWSPEKANGSLAHVKPNVLVPNSDEFGYINVRNGMLDVETGTLLRHLPQYHSTWQLDVDWDPTADTAEVDTFVSQILREEDLPVWWMFAGYIFVTKVPLPYRSILVLQGPKRTGKSTLLNAAVQLLQSDHVSSLGLQELTSGGSFVASFLEGKLVNMDLDADYNAHVQDYSLMKKLAAGDAVSIQPKGQQARTASLPIKLAFAMNAWPRLTGADAGFYDRIVVLGTKQNHIFHRGGEDTHTNAEKRLLSVARNRSAWLRRAVEGIGALKDLGGFPVTKAAETDKVEMRRQSDVVFDFWLTTTEDCNGEYTWTGKEVYATFEMWCALSGRQAKVPGNITFWNRTREYEAESLLGSLKVLRTAVGNVVRGRKLVE